MSRRVFSWLFFPLLVGLALPWTAAAQAPKAIVWKASGKHGAVAAGGQESSEAGLAILKADGNAADAAVATILALCVTDAPICVFGGEVPIMIYNARRNTVEVLCGLGTAPKLATRDYFVKKGGIPGGGLECAAVPATIDACVVALERHGTMTFGQVAAPTLKLLDEYHLRNKGKFWHGDMAVTLRRLIAAEKAEPKDRVRGLRLVADYFYRGPLAREIDAWMRAKNGLIRYADLATHVTRIEDPVDVTYRGHKVYKCGAWNQGPYLLETLKLLEGFDLKALGHNSPDYIHVCAEAMKLGLADRDFHYADPLFSDIPLAQLLSAKYADLRRPLIDLKKASQEQRPGDPRNMRALLDNPDMRKGPGGPAKDTTTCVVADKWGNVVAATPSGFNGVVVGKTGIWLGCRLQSFNLWEGHPNCIEPGKRPRITLTPGLVFKDGKPLLGVSCAGGDGQDQACLQGILNSLDFGMRPEEAVTRLRFYTDHYMTSFKQGSPKLGNLVLPTTFGMKTTHELATRGHKITTFSGTANTRMVILRIDPVTGLFEAAGDPTGRRSAAAY